MRRCPMPRLWFTATQHGTDGLRACPSVWCVSHVHLCGVVSWYSTVNILYSMRVSPSVCGTDGMRVNVCPRLHYRLLTLCPAPTDPVPRSLLTLWARAGMCVRACVYEGERREGRMQGGRDRDKEGAREVLIQRPRPCQSPYVHGRTLRIHPPSLSFHSCSKPLLLPLPLPLPLPLLLLLPQPLPFPLALLTHTLSLTLFHTHAHNTCSPWDIP